MMVNKQQYSKKEKYPKKEQKSKQEQSSKKKEKYLNKQSMKQEQYSEKELLNIAARTGVSFETNDKEEVDRILKFLELDSEEKTFQDLAERDDIISSLLPFLEILPTTKVDIREGDKDDEIWVFVDDKDVGKCPSSHTFEIKNGKQFKVEVQSAGNMILTEKEIWTHKTSPDDEIKGLSEMFPKSVLEESHILARYNFLYNGYKS